MWQAIFLSRNSRPTLYCRSNNINALVVTSTLETLDKIDALVSSWKEQGQQMPNMEEQEEPQKDSKKAAKKESRKEAKKESRKRRRDQSTEPVALL